MSELTDQIWCELYRPSTWDNLIFGQKDQIQKILANPNSIPSMIFYSSKPGTGKTSTAKLIVRELGCDCLTLNSGLDRSIEFVRSEVNHFARSMSSTPGLKRCVFMDEFDAVLKPAQESLKNLMEEFSNNCFFIFTANNLGKIIEPIQSRCQKFAFESPSKANIMVRLSEICDTEKLDIAPVLIEKLVDKCYPDIRRMLQALQMYSIKGTLGLEDDVVVYEKFLGYIKSKQVGLICQTVYSGDFDVLGFNCWYFHKLYQDFKPENFEYTRKAALLLAEVEKNSGLQVNLEIIAISSYLGICGLQ